MDLFTEILPGVRETLGDASASKVEGLLNVLVEEGAISREYQHALLQEADRDDLARKISLHLLETWAQPRSLLHPLHCPQDWGSPPGDPPSTVPARSGGLSDSAMDPGVLAGKSYLDLLCSEVDPFLLCRQIEEEEENVLPAQSADPLGHDPDSNADLFYTVESDGAGEQLQLCSNTGEAYDKIAALDHYVFRDQESVEDLFGRLISDETAAEYSGSGTEGKKRSSSADPLDPKRRKVAHGPVLYVVNGSSAGVPLSSPPAVGTPPQPHFQVQFCMTARGPAGRAPKAFGPSVSPNAAFFPRGAKDIQVIVIVEPVPQLVPLPAGQPGAPDRSISPGGDAMEKGPEIPPTSPGQVRNRPDPVTETQRQLKSYFQESCRLAPTARETPLEQLYVDRDLVQRPAESRGGRGADPRACEEQAQAPVARSRLLPVAGRPDGGTKVVLVLGRAGLGKSLLAQKVCLDWSRGQWGEFDLLLRFDCWRLSLLLGEPCGLRRLLFELSDCGGLEAGDAVWRQVLRRPEKVLLLLDGLEALRAQDGLLPGPAESLGAVLAGLLQKKLLQGCTLLLTAHPKDRLHQHLPRPDRVLELPGLSPPQAELCLARHLEGSPAAGEWLRSLQGRPFLRSLCRTPGLCRFLAECVAEAGGAQGLPDTLSGLFVQALRRKLARAPPAQRSALLPLAELAWTASQTRPGALLGRHFPSPAVEALALGAGLLRPVPLPPGSPERGYAFASLALQHFLLALRLALAEDVRDKRLTKHLQLLGRARRPAWELVPRFLAGLLFLPAELSPATLLGEEGRPEAEALLAKKQRSLSRYLRRLPVGDLGPQRLLELCHCVHESRDPGLLRHLALALRPGLSFRGLPLAPPDAHVLAHVLGRSAQPLALDLRQAVDLEGLRQLVGVRSVASFRASLGDAVRLWRHLWEAGQGEQLQAAIQKFAVVPFKAETPKDVDDLSALVCLQEELARGKADLPGCTIRAIPAVADLRQLDFSLGPLHGPKAFRKLVEILDAFPRLQHLDLDAQNENEIGDEGVSSLCNVLPRLASLEILNLSQNKITDRGAEQLAQALPSLRSLKTLSMYNNDIGDGGAESMAKVLPQVVSLKVLDIHCNKITAAGAQHLIDSLKACPGIQTVALWNSTIPYGVLKHLQQLDSRIRSL